MLFSSSLQEFSAKIAFFLKKSPENMLQNMLCDAIIQILSRDLHYFKVSEAAIVDVEPDKRSYLLPALQPCSSGVDVQQAQFFIILYFENVTVARDEEFGRIGNDLLSDAGIVMPRIAPDVCHQNICTFTGPSELLRE